MNRQDRVLCLLVVLVGCASSCASPAQGFRSTEVDPDMRLLQLVDEYRGHVDAPACQECGSPEGHVCVGGCPSFPDRGHVITDPERSRNQISRLHLEFPRHVPTLYANATLSYEEGEIEKAASYLDALFKREPVHPEAGILRSRIAIQEGNLPAARRVLEQQLRYRPDHAGLYEAVSCVHYLSDELAKTVLTLDMAQRLGAPSWRIDFSRGLVAEAAGEPGHAMRLYERALSFNPDCVEAASRLAGLRAAAGEALR